MTKLAFAAAMFGHLRREVTSMVSRHAIVLACAVGGDAGSTLREISERLGDQDPNSIATQTGKYADQGLLQIINHGELPRRYAVAPLGLKLIAPIINARPLDA